MFAERALTILAVGTVLLTSACAASPKVANKVNVAAQPADQARWAAHCERWDDWNKAAPPFKVFGNTYYVGTCGISAILVAGEDGHILIDSGTEAGADVVAANITALGFKLNDIKLLLHSHEHFDHVGGHAKIQALTHAKVVASITGARVLGTGVADGNDPQSGMHAPMKPVAANILVLDGEPIRLGNLQLTAIETPGHTPGALSWQWRSCDGSDCQSVVYADSLSPVSSDAYRFSEHAGYVAAYRQSLGRVARLDCDILLTPHPSASEMVRHLQGGKGLVDPQACARYAQRIDERLDKRLDEEVNKPHGG